MWLPGRNKSPIDVWLALVLATGLAGVLIDLGRFHHAVHADGLLPVLMSLQKWTPFLWGQDRLGAPVAWLAMPIRHPLYNLLFQAGVMIWLGLLAPALVARAAGLRAEAAAVGAVVSLILIALLGRFRLYDLLWIQPYAPSLCLGALGVLLLDSRVRMVRWGGFVCVLLGHYLNVALVLPLLPLVMLRPRAGCHHQQPANALPSPPSSQGGEPKRLDSAPPLDEGGLAGVRSGQPLAVKLSPAGGRLVGAAAILVCFACSVGGSRLADAPHEAYAPRPPAEWGAAYRGLTATLLVKVPNRMWIGCSMLVVAGAVGVRNLPAGERRRVLAAAGALLAGAAGHFLVLGPSRHVVIDTLSCKYSYMSLLLLLVALAGFGVAPWLVRLEARGRGTLTFGLLAALVVSAPLRFGPPSIEGVTRGLRAHSGAVARDVLDNRARFLIGTYWKVYPALFLANLDAYDGGRREPIWGITEKAGATRLLWRRSIGQGERYATLAGDEKAARFFMRYCRLPALKRVTRTTRVMIWREVPLAGNGPPYGDSTIDRSGRVWRNHLTVRSMLSR
jgi:hypothetical protein